MKLYRKVMVFWKRFIAYVQIQLMYFVLYLKFYFTFEKSWHNFQVLIQLWSFVTAQKGQKNSKISPLLFVKSNLKRCLIFSFKNLTVSVFFWKVQQNLWTYRILKKYIPNCILNLLVTWRNFPKETTCVISINIPRLWF